MDERDVEVRYESVSWTVATVRSCPRLQNAFRIYKTLILIWEKLLTTTVVKLKGNTGTRLVLGRKCKIELPHHKLLWDYTNRCRCRRDTSTVEDRASSTMTCRWGYICWHLDWSDDMDVVLTDEVMINMWRCIFQSILVRQNNVGYIEHPTVYRLDDFPWEFRISGREPYQITIVKFKKEGDPQFWAPCPAFRSGPVWENLSSQTCPDCPDCLQKVLRSSVEWWQAFTFKIWSQTSF